MSLKRDILLRTSLVYLGMLLTGLLILGKILHLQIRVLGATLDLDDILLHLGQLGRRVALSSFLMIDLLHELLGGFVEVQQEHDKVSTDETGHDPVEPIAHGWAPSLFASGGAVGGVP